MAMKSSSDNVECHDIHKTSTPKAHYGGKLFGQLNGSLVRPLARGQERTYWKRRFLDALVLTTYELRKSNWIFYKYLIIKHSYLIINFWETKQKQKWRETRFCSFTCFPCFLSCQIPSFLCLDEKTIVRFVGLICFLRTTWLGVSFPYNQFGCWNPSVKLAIALSLVRRFFAVKGRKTSCTSSTVLCFCSWRKRSLRFSSFRRTYIQFTLG